MEVPFDYFELYPPEWEIFLHISISYITELKMYLLDDINISYT